MTQCEMTLKRLSFKKKKSCAVWFWRDFPPLFPLRVFSFVKAKWRFSTTLRKWRKKKKCRKHKSAIGCAITSSESMALIRWSLTSYRVSWLNLNIRWTRNHELVFAFVFIIPAVAFSCARQGAKMAQRTLRKQRIASTNITMMMMDV